MKDRFENFIEKHRSEFDHLEPDERIWDDIQDSLESKPRQIERYAWVWKVAAMLFLSLSVFLYWDKSEGLVSQGETEIVDEANELDEVEEFYFNEIDKKKNEVLKLANHEELIYQELVHDLYGLDSIYQVLKTDLSLNENDERIINAMIRNLQIQTELLNKQAQVLQKIKTDEKDIII